MRIVKFAAVLLGTSALLLPGLSPAQAAGGQGIGRKGHDKRARVRKTA